MRTLLLCLDGVPHDLASSFIEEGITPNLASIAQEGTFFPLRSVYPPVTAPAFASILTGQTPTNHGVLHFKKDPLDAYGRRGTIGLDDEGGTAEIDRGGQGTFVTSSMIRGKTFLDQMSMGGLGIGTIGVPLTYPPWDLGAFMVCGFLTPPSATGWALPGSLRDEIVRLFPDYLVDLEWQLDCLLDSARGSAQEGEESGLWWTHLDMDERGRRLLRQADRVIRQRTELAIRLMDVYDPDLMMVYYRPTDILQHYYLDREEVMAASYAYLDRNLGKLIERVGPDSNIFVISDHGFRLSPGRAFNTNAWIRREGYLRLKGGLPDRVYRLAYLAGRSVKRRLRPARRGRAPSGKGISSGLARRGKDPIDWQRTKAYGAKGGICVKEGSDAGETARELRDRLARLRDPIDGNPAMDWVALRQEAFQGPHTGKLPHIVFSPRRELVASLRLVTEVFSPAPRTERPGTHAMTGIFLARGRDISHGGMAGTASLVDIAPTILHLHGLGIPERMEGRVLPIFRTGSEAGERSPLRVSSSTLSAAERAGLKRLRRKMAGKPATRRT